MGRLDRVVWTRSKWEKLAVAGRCLMEVSWVSYWISRHPDLESWWLGEAVGSLAADAQPPPEEGGEMDTAW